MHYTKAHGADASHRSSWYWCTFHRLTGAGPVVHPEVSSEAVTLIRALGVAASVGTAAVVVRALVDICGNERVIGITVPSHHISISPQCHITTVP